MSKKNKKILTLAIATLIITAILEVIFVEACHFFAYNIASIIMLALIVTLVLIHFMYGFKNTANYIAKNRYKISGCLIVLFTVLGYFENNMEVKDWLLAIDVPLCLIWNIKFFAVMIFSYEFFKVFIKDDNYSIIGSILVSFSGFIQWDFMYMESIIVGEFFVITLSRIIEKDGKLRILNSLLLGLSMILYTFTFQGFAVSFGYVFLAIVVWLFIDKKDLIKKNLKSILLSLIITIVIASGISILAHNFIEYHDLYYEVNVKNHTMNYMLTYVYNTVMPYMENPVVSNMGNFVSLFPVTLLFAMYYLYKKEKHIEFLMPLVVVSVLEIVVMLLGLTGPIETITLLKNEYRVFMMPAISFASLLMLIYILKNIDEENFSFISSIRITMVTLIVLALIPRPFGYTQLGYLYYTAAVVTSLVFLFLNIGDKKYKKVFIAMLIIFTLMSGISVNHVMKDRQMEAQHREILNDK